MQLLAASPRARRHLSRIARRFELDRLIRGGEILRCCFDELLPVFGRCRMSAQPELSALKLDDEPGRRLGVRVGGTPVGQARVALKNAEIKNAETHQ